MLPQVIQSKGALMGGYRHIYCSLKLDSLLLWFYLSTYVEKKTHTQQQQLAVLSFVLYLSSYRKRTCVHKVFHVSHSELFHKSFLQENDSSKLPHLTSGSSTHPSLPWINFQAHEIGKITIEHSTLYFKFDFILILIYYNHLY